MNDWEEKYLRFIEAENEFHRLERLSQQASNAMNEQREVVYRTRNNYSKAYTEYLVQLEDRKARGL